MLKKIFMLLVMSILLFSCSTTKLETSEGASGDALLTGLSVRLDFADNTSLLEGVVGALNLEGLGMNTESSIAAFLSANDFQQVKDKDVAQRETLPTLVEGIPGYWLHPETSNYTPDYFTGLAIGFDAKEHITGLKGDSSYEYFTFADVSVRKANTIGFFGGYPVAFMRVCVVDTNGEVVLQAKASGQGKKQIIGADLSEENLTLALENAIMKLNELAK